MADVLKVLPKMRLRATVVWLKRTCSLAMRNIRMQFLLALQMVSRGQVDVSVSNQVENSLLVMKLGPSLAFSMTPRQCMQVWPKPILAYNLYLRPVDTKMRRN